MATLKFKAEEKYIQFYDMPVWYDSRKYMNCITDYHFMTYLMPSPHYLANSVSCNLFHISYIPLGCQELCHPI